MILRFLRLCDWEDGHAVTIINEEAMSWNKEGDECNSGLANFRAPLEHLGRDVRKVF